MKTRSNSKTPRPTGRLAKDSRGRKRPLGADKGAAAPRRRAGADRPDRKGPARAAHVEAFQKRQKRPGAAGLANEARPGLGSRADDERDTKPEEGAPLATARKPRAPSAAKKYRPPPPDPQEQPPDSLDHEMERSTGMSGQSSGT